MSNRLIRSAAAAAAALGAALVMPGCGVGVGGTGTGEDLVAFGATASSVCAAPIASALSCPGSGATVEEGSARRFFVDADFGGRVLATVDGNRIDFEARCAGLSFAGTWGQSADSRGRYFGSIVRLGQTQRQLALLDASLPSGEPAAELVATLRDANNQPLVPKTVLRSVAALPAVLPACPP